jgi:hypothetical protein
LVDEHGKLVAKKRIHETLEGWQQLLDLLTAAGDSAETPIPVAIETPRGLLVTALRATGRPVYAINPMAVARYRDRHTVARSKSDHADAVVLANILRTDAHVHRTLPADTELARAIAVLARAHQDATWRRTKASNELRSLLREYYPAFLDAFSNRKDFLASADARAVLAIAPTPAGARQADQDADRGRPAPGRPQTRRRRPHRRTPSRAASFSSAPAAARRRSHGHRHSGLACRARHRLHQRRPTR